MKFFKAVKERLKSIIYAWGRFPVVFALLGAIAVLLSIKVEDYTKDFGREILALVLGVFLSAAATVLFEKSIKPLLYLVISQAAVLGLAAAYYFLALAGYSGGTADTLRVVILCVALFLVFLWVPSFRWKTDFNDMFMSIFKGFFTTAFFMGIVFGGISLILAAVDSLLFPIRENLYPHIGLWIAVFFSPMLLLSLVPVFGDMEEDRLQREHFAQVPKFFAILISYVLIPLAAVYTVVLLAYLVKSLMSGDQQDLLRPLIMSYCISVIVLYVLSSKIENKISSLSRMVFPKLMIVIALYQAVMLAVRLPEEGVVYSRYILILFTIFSIVAGILMSVLPLRRNAILAVILTGVALVSVTPPIDAFTVGTASQLQILNRIFAENNMLEDGAVVPNADLADKDKSTVTAVVSYLDEMGELDRIGGVPSGFGFGDFRKTFGFDPYYGQTQEPYMSFYFSLDKSTPVEIGTYDYLVYLENINSSSNVSDHAAAVTNEGSDYYVDYVRDGSRVGFRLADAKGNALLSASLSDMIDEIAAKANTNQKDVMPLEDMTFDVSGTGIKAKVIFEYATKEVPGSQAAYYDGGVMILLDFE